MARTEILVGVEIGTSKICVVVGEIRQGESIHILGVGHVPSRGVRKGEIVDFDTAGKCLRDALIEAEQGAEVEIGSVYMAVTGAHITAFNSRGSVVVPEDRDEITEEDLDDVKQSAREVSIPNENTFLHNIIQNYFVDGQAGVLNPEGMFGRKLEADFHIVHGIMTRIQNTVRCVREVPLEVEDVVFSPLASSLAVLNQQYKNLGALLVDMGGGTCDYIMFSEGVVRQSGVLGVGGDHITNDISIGLRIPMARAEKLKVEEGSVSLGNALPGETISLKDDAGFAGKEIERETLNTIMHLRVRETLELLKSRLEREPALNYLGAGVFLTGGCSLIDGIQPLAEEIFGMPVHCLQPANLSGVTSAFENPQYSTAIGLIQYGHRMEKEVSAGTLSRIKKRLFGWVGGR